MGILTDLPEPKGDLAGEVPTSLPREEAVGVRK